METSEEPPGHRVAARDYYEHPVIQLSLPCEADPGRCPFSQSGLGGFKRSAGAACCQSNPGQVREAALHYATRATAALVGINALVVWLLPDTRAHLVATLALWAIAGARWGLMLQSNKF